MAPAMITSPLGTGPCCPICPTVARCPGAHRAARSTLRTRRPPGWTELGHLWGMTLSIHSPDELIAALPHLLGFKPEESLTFVPLRPGLPVARVDLPVTARERDGVWDAVGEVFRRHAQPGAQMAVVCVTADREGADHLTQHFAARLTSIGIAAGLRLWANDTHVCDFTTGEAGLQTEAARTAVTASAVLQGRARPATSRASLAASLVGDREPVAALLTEAREARARCTLRVEESWSLARLREFHRDGVRLSDQDAARLLVGVESLRIRDGLWDDINRSTVGSHVALWRDLTRRAPDEVRAAPASLLAFASWFNGEGATAWCALDQVPTDEPYSIALLVASALHGGVDPRTWEQATSQSHDSNPAPGTDLTRSRSSIQPHSTRVARGL